MTASSTGEETAVAIVVHPPLSGDPQRIAMLSPEALAEPDVNTPPALRELPAGIRDPYEHQAALARSAAAAQVRVLGLDAVRGICLLAMNITFALPEPLLLPAWMYHMQLPPPRGVYVALSGLTWQDIIFPGFLFAMAAAVPIRGSFLVASGQPTPKIIWGALQRTALLYVFSLIIAHVNPFYTHLDNKAGNVMAIAGFITCFALFVRRRPGWNAATFRWVRRAGWLGAAVILFALPMTWGATFSPMRRDTIITAIAFTYFATSVIWVLTRQRPGARLAIILAIALLKVMAPAVDGLEAVLSTTALPWIYEPWYLELLLITLPGIIAGDLLVEWTKHSRSATPLEPRSRTRLLGVAALGFTAPVVFLVGLYQRNLLGTTAATLGIVLVAGALLSRGSSEREQLLRRIGAWAGALLIAGVLLEPLEGGIKKDPQTLSFLLLCAGMWLGVLLASTIIIDVIGGKVRRIAEPVILAGQNAMFAYVIFMLFLMHAAYLMGFGDFLSATAPEQAGRAAIVAVTVMAILWASTKKGIVWRS